MCRSVLVFWRVGAILNVCGAAVVHLFVAQDEPASVFEFSDFVIYDSGA